MRRFLAAALALATLSGCNVAGVRVTREGIEPLRTARVEDVVATQWRAQQATLEAQASKPTPEQVAWDAKPYAERVAISARRMADDAERYCQSTYVRSHSWSSVHGQEPNSGAVTLYNFAATQVVVDGAPAVSAVRLISAHAPRALALGEPPMCILTLAMADGTTRVVPDSLLR